MRFVFKNIIRRLKTKIRRLEDNQWYSSGITEIKFKEVEELKFKFKVNAGQLPGVLGQATSKHEELAK